MFCENSGNPVFVGLVSFACGVEEVQRLTRNMLAIRRGIITRRGVLSSLSSERFLSGKDYQGSCIAGTSAASGTWLPPAMARCRRRASIVAKVLDIEPGLTGQGGQLNSN